MDPGQVPYDWVGRQVELWTLSGAPSVATDVGQLMDVTELGIVLRAHGRGDDSSADAFYPWGVIYRITPTPE